MQMTGSRLWHVGVCLGIRFGTVRLPIWNGDLGRAAPIFAQVGKETGGEGEWA